MWVSIPHLKYWGLEKVKFFFFRFELFAYANEVSWEGPKVKQEVHLCFIYTSDTAGG